MNATLEKVINNLDDTHYARAIRSRKCFDAHCSTSEVAERCFKQYVYQLYAEQLGEELRAQNARVYRFKIVDKDCPVKTIAQFRTRKQAEEQLKNYAGREWLRVIEFAGFLPEDK